MKPKIFAIGLAASILLSGCASTSHPSFEYSHEIPATPKSTSGPTPEPSPVPSTSPIPDSTNHEYCDFFQFLLSEGAEIPDYDIYSTPASENGKGDTEIIMYGIIDKVYDVNGFMVVDFLESGKNIYAMNLGSPDEEIRKTYEDLCGEWVEVNGIYTGYSDILHVPCGSLYMIYHDGQLDSSSLVHLAGDGITNYQGGDEYDVPSDEPPVDESSVSSEPETATLSQSNALKKAKEYLGVLSFSYDGLISQLEYEKFTHEDAVYAADHCGADWNEQAKSKAEQYLAVMSFSREGLINQLIYDGFTREQATYGVDSVGL